MNRSMPILMVENNRADATAIERAFEELGVASPRICATDGRQAWIQLQRLTERKPWFILLSLDLPGMTGEEFLATVKSDEAVKTVPVVVLTASDDPDRISRSFELGAAGYMVKTANYRELLDTIRIVVQYWSLCEWPPDAR